MAIASTKQAGFTIVELLIVIVVIGILAAITIVAYNGVQEKANLARIKSDTAAISKAIFAARESQSATMVDITGSSYSAGGCVSKPAGTDLAALPRTDSCWVSYQLMLDRISAAGGGDIRSLVDPWGRPYFIDENEGERGGCNLDVISVYTRPTNGSARQAGTSLTVPLSGYSGCGS